MESIPETEETRKPDQARTTSSADPTSPDLGPRGPDLAGLQAERDVVSMRERHQLGEKDFLDKSDLEWEIQECGTSRYD